MKELLGLVKEGGVLYIYDLAREVPSKQITKRLGTFKNEHEKRRFLQSLNASLTIKEMKKIFGKLGIKKFQYIYPLKFSKKNFKYHKSLIEKDKTKEYNFKALSRIYLIKKV